MRSLAATILATLAATSCAEPFSPTPELRAPPEPAIRRAGIVTTDLGTLPNGSGSVARAIDAAGTTIVGYAAPSTEPGVPWRATRWRLTNGVWTIEDLTGFFPSGAISSSAWDINGDGDIVGHMGQIYGYDHAYLLANGAAQATDLHAPLCNGATDNGISSSAYAINANDEVVGVRYEPYTNSASARAFHWAAGCATLLPTLGDPSSPERTYDVATDINDNGVVVGYSRDVGGVYRAVRWTKTINADGTATWEIAQLPMPLGFTSGGVASAINNAGVIVGSGGDAAGAKVALCWEPSGEVTTMPTLGGDSHPWAINAAGDAVGYSRDNSFVQHAVRWPAAGGIQKLARLGNAYDLDDNKQIAGNKSSKGGDFTYFATLWILP
jgi:probable HAF family extracellular repeat protein